MFRDYFILLLASYDPETKSVIDFLKTTLQDKFLGEKVNLHIFVLENIDVYGTYPENYAFIKETIDGNSYLYIFKNKTIIEILKMKDNNIKNVIKTIETIPRDINITKLPIIDKFIFLASIIRKIFVIRHKEETRGGEYIELALLSQDEEFARRTVFFQRETIEVSTMVWEILDMKNINMRVYKNHEELGEIIERIIRYGL
jgi:hypothetical protein